MLGCIQQQIVVAIQSNLEFPFLHPLDISIFSRPPLVTTLRLSFDLYYALGFLRCYNNRSTLILILVFFILSLQTSTFKSFYLPSRESVADSHGVIFS